jgi:signal transduction histidine kinase
MPASSEFLTLCRSQVALLSHGLGATLSVVYLAEKLVEGAEAKLIPVVVYPETAMMWAENLALAMPQELAENVGSLPPLLASGTPVVTPEPDSNAQDWEANNIPLDRRLLLPLLHEGVAMGLLVVARENRPWRERERGQIERIAQTLAIACWLDRRQSWLERRLTQQQHLQKQQRRLLDNLLHQLRNPLTALRTFGKLLLRRFLPDDPNREVATAILRESDRLQELLQQFEVGLDLTAGEPESLSLGAATLEEEQAAEVANSPWLLLPEGNSSRKTLHLEPCSIAEIVTPLLVAARAIAQEKNIDLTAEIPQNLPSVLANSQALGEVLSNTIDNALKYTPAGGRIAIEVGRERGRGREGERERGSRGAGEQGENSLTQHSTLNTQHCIMQGISISDTGCGIPPEDLEHLFERHYRGVQAESEIPGTGLGLAIAKELVEKMQGEIQLFSPASIGRKSATQGPGTTVIVWLPVTGES